MSDQSIVEVTQADRDAAADLNWLTNPAYAFNLKNGTGDRNQLVQAFARHRIAEREACAMVAEDCVADIPHCQQAASLIAAAIRARS